MRNIRREYGIDPHIQWCHYSVMKMSEHSEKLRASLLRTAAMGDESTKEMATQLVDAIEPAMQLQGLAMAAELASEINRLTNSIHVDVVMTPDGATLRVVAVEVPEPEPEPWIAEPESDETVRITLRIPRNLKKQVDGLAQTAGKSLNAWIVGAMRLGVAHEGKRERASHASTASFASTLRGWVK